MKRFTVHVFTNEHPIDVVIGKNKELIQEVYLKTLKRLELDDIKKDIEDSDGSFWSNTTDKYTPLIVINSEGNDYHSQIHTLAHEATHAGLHLQEKLGIEDKSGEFLAYSVETIMKEGLKHIKKK